MFSVNASNFYKNVSLHKRLGCSDDCPLLKSSYNNDLWHLAESAAQRAGRPFDATFNLSSAVGHGAITPPFRIDLIDGELHGDAYIWIAAKSDDQDASPETPDRVYRQMLAIFTENQKQDFQPVFGPNLELLLWCALGTRSIKALNAALRLHQHLKTPTCISMSLLCAAIDSNFQEAIPVLLGRSKSGDSTKPLIALFRRFSANFTELIEQREDAQTTAKGLIHVYKLLINHFGIENFLSKLCVDILKSYQVISYLAMFDQDEAFRLIEALPDSVFKADGDCESLLMSTFFDAAQIWQVNSGIITGAILPLLRCGAAGYPDLLDFNPDSILGMRFQAVNATKFIQHNEIAAHIVLEMRPSQKRCCLNVPELVKTSDALTNNDDTFVYKTFFQKFYPRTLQAHCRTVILKCLPIGFKARYNAIESLNLAIFLSDFLQFKELYDLLLTDD